MGTHASPQGNEHLSQMAQHSEGRLTGGALARAAWMIAAVIAMAVTTPASPYSSWLWDEPQAVAKTKQRDRTAMARAMVI
jgi:hypothetical protein